MGSREGQVEKGKLIKGGYLESEDSLGIDRVGQVLILRHLSRDDTRKWLYDANWVTTDVLIAEDQASCFFWVFSFFLPILTLSAHFLSEKIEDSSNSLPPELSFQLFMRKCRLRLLSKAR
ncbi:hypothetical protein ACFXTN_041610 [Malus domestica]